MSQNGSCVVPGCEDRLRAVNSSEDISPRRFFEFPKSEVMRRLWLATLNLKSHDILDGALICNSHFSSNDFFTTSTTMEKILLPEAVPNASKMGPFRASGELMAKLSSQRSLSLPCKQACQNDSNNTPQPVCEFQVGIPLHVDRGLS